MPNIALPIIEDSNLISIRASTKGHFSNRKGILLFIIPYVTVYYNCKGSYFSDMKINFMP